MNHDRSLSVVFSHYSRKSRKDNESVSLDGDRETTPIITAHRLKARLKTNTLDSTLYIDKNLGLFETRALVTVSNGFDTRRVGEGSERLS
jgi:hypothetical protein